MDFKSEKNRLRKLALARRSALAPEEVARCGGLIVARLLASEIDLSGVVALYSAIRGEVAIDELIGRVGRAVYPRVLPNGLLEFREVSDAGDLRPGSWGILEPTTDAPAIDPGQINVVIVPGCAYTEQGRRLGYGGGYYDRLFGERRHIRRVAPAFEIQIVDSLPMEEHDMLVDIIVTERREIAAYKYRKENGQ